MGMVFYDTGGGGGGGGTDPGGGWQDMKTSLNIIARTTDLEAATCANILAGLSRFPGVKQVGAPTMTKVQGVTNTAAAGQTTISATISEATKGNVLYAGCLVYGSFSDPGIEIPAGYQDNDLGDAGITNGGAGVWIRDVTKVAAGGETSVTFTLSDAGLFTKGLEICVVELSGWTGSPALDYDGSADTTSVNPDAGLLSAPPFPFNHRAAVAISTFASDPVLSGVAGVFNPVANYTLATYASASGRLILGWALAYPETGDNYAQWTWTPDPVSGVIAVNTMLELDVLNTTAAATQLDLLGALNVWAGNGSNPSNWRGLNAVANQLAGTTGLEANHAFAKLAGLITT
jgi:hypothetical protein